jgi:hypothetical protein
VPVHKEDFLLIVTIDKNDLIAYQQIYLYMHEHLVTIFEPSVEENVTLVNIVMFHHMLSWMYYLSMELLQDHLMDFVQLYQNLKNPENFISLEN